MIKLFQGDSLQFLPTIESGIFDSCITDSPYSAAWVGTLYNKLKQYQSNKANLNKNRPYNPWNWGGIPGYWSDSFYKTNNEYEDFTSSWVKEVFRLLKPGGFLASFGSHKLINVNINIAQSHGFNLRDILIWEYSPTFSKGYSLDRITGDDNDKPCKTICANSYEPILLLQKPPDKNFIKNYKINETGFIDSRYIKGNIIKVGKPSKSEKGDNPHYSVKPRQLIEILVRGLRCKSIIDPFMGSGTIPFVCKQLGVDCIGIELEEDFFNYSQKLLGGA